MKKWIILGVVALMLLGIAGGFFLTHCYVEGELVYRQTEKLDLSGREITDLERICQLKNLKELNVEDTGLTISQYETLRAALPGCNIRWKVPFQGSYYAPDTASLTVTTLSQDDLLVLDYFPNLTAVDATACRDYEALAQLQAKRPGCTVSYSVDLGGQTLPDTATVLNVHSDSLADIEKAVSLLPQLQSITITGCTDALGLKALADKYPNCHFTYEIYIGSQVFTTDTASMTLAPEELPVLEAVLPCFSQLAEVTFSGDAPQAHALADRYPDITFHYGFSLLGQNVHTDQEFVDLSGTVLENTGELEAALPYFHRLSQVDMVGCKISNEDMEALNDRHPETLFVWTVKIAGATFRTDIKTFYPTGLELSPTDDNIKNLRYCTEIETLDLGHFELTDCSFVAYMPKMKHLILAIGSIEDIRPIGTLKELRHLELFMTRARDYWPLVNCTKLEDLNLAFSGHGDITPLLQMPWLKKLWFCKHFTTDEEMALFEQYLPNTIIIYESDSSTNRGWRYGVNYYEMRDALGTYDMP